MISEFGRLRQEACCKFKASLEYSMKLHFKTPKKNYNNIQNNKKFVYQDSLKNKVCQFWILFPICMGSI